MHHTVVSHCGFDARVAAIFNQQKQASLVYIFHQFSFALFRALAINKSVLLCLFVAVVSAAGTNGGGTNEIMLAVSLLFVKTNSVY